MLCMGTSWLPPWCPMMQTINVVFFVNIFWVYLSFPELFVGHRDSLIDILLLMCWKRLYCLYGSPWHVFLFWPVSLTCQNYSLCCSHPLESCSTFQRFPFLSSLLLSFIIHCWGFGLNGVNLLQASSRNSFNIFCITQKHFAFKFAF